ncbi:MAG TPA: type I-E CRISPR-associated protein Cas7/Cse4/CasC, partial [Mycobacteriales bacterium]|nr:type I-E CRISPR-associated protein Cas7/Cse4/CasC [Mycobacteriales bacterium]
ASDTAYLLFFGRPQLERLADLVADRAPELADLDDDKLAGELKDLPVKETLATGHPIDVALFGRMVADIPALNVDAATQVAHALSTHAVEVEFDYYTAVDDENTEDAGAGMIGTVEFNSATLYRFATVGLHQLVDNLGGDVEATLAALEVFLTAFTRSMPTGHQNTFAHRTLPGLVSVAVRGDQPVNLVSAFEAPVRGTSGIAAKSATLLAAEMRRTSDQWGMPPLRTASTYTPPDDENDRASMAAAFGPPMPFGDLVAAITATARERMADQVPA